MNLNMSTLIATMAVRHASHCSFSKLALAQGHEPFIHNWISKISHLYIVIPSRFSLNSPYNHQKLPLVACNGILLPL